MNKSIRIPIFLLALLCGLLHGYDAIRPGLENFESRPLSQEERQYLQEMQVPFFQGKDISQSLQHWFDFHKSFSRPHQKTDAFLHQARIALKNAPTLPMPAFPPLPDATFTQRIKLTSSRPGIQLELVQWEVDRLQLYGLLIYPKTPAKKLPVMLYCHGAAVGIPPYFLNWLENLAQQGYLVLAPAFRGEPLFQGKKTIRGKAWVSQGQVEDFGGEPSDCLAMLSAAWKLPFVRPNEFAAVGHSFGAGIAILTAIRAGHPAKAIVSYDAWFLNPHRYYWDRMRRAPRNWDTWEQYCAQSVRNQLIGLLQRSVYHNAEKINCPLLMFIGGNYQGSVFHQSHEDLCKYLTAHKKQHRYIVVPNAGHNFVLYEESEPARRALQEQTHFLQKYYPPAAIPANDTLPQNPDSAK